MAFLNIPLVLWTASDERSCCAALACAATLSWHCSITKQMQIGLARGLAQLTKGSCVTVNSILPGPTWTEGVQTFVEGLAKQENTTITDATINYFKQREPTSLLQRFIQPSEVAATAVFLASKGAAATNGAAIRCEGGLISHV